MQLTPTGAKDGVKILSVTPAPEYVPPKGKPSVKRTG